MIPPDPLRNLGPAEECPACKSSRFYGTADYLYCRNCGFRIGNPHAMDCSSEEPL